MHETITGYSFRPDDLAVAQRLPGISLFMRVRNGRDFLELAIRSHIEAVDEIVAVYNQCTDGSEDLLHRLAGELGPKLRLVHYTDRVFPPGSEGHAREPAASPASFVNMSNLALAKTRYRVAMKLDDDHVAIADRFARLAAHVRAQGADLNRTICFGGINLARDEAGQIGIPRFEPLVGGGDHFLFKVGPSTFFRHDERFEHFHHADRRAFYDVTYWHLKYLKAGLGFANYEMEQRPNPRFERKKKRFMANRGLMSVEALAASIPAWVGLARHLPLPEKAQIRLARAHSIRTNPPPLDLEAYVL